MAPRESRSNAMFVVLLVVLGLVVWYGGVFATGQSCSTGKASFVLTPPPHWTCPGGFQP